MDRSGNPSEISDLIKGVTLHKNRNLGTGSYKWCYLLKIFFIQGQQMSFIQKQMLLLLLLLLLLILLYVFIT